MSSGVSLRPATADDEQRILEWRNEPGARAASFTTEAIPPARHHEWFRKKLDDSDCMIFIIEHNGVAIGNVRVDRDGGDTAEAHICLDAGSRGRGLSGPALGAACSEAFRRMPVAAINARIKEGNAPSVRLFQSVGFVHSDTETKAGGRALVYRLARSPQ